MPRRRVTNTAAAVLLTSSLLLPCGQQPQKHLADSAATQCIDISARQHLTTGEKLSMDEMGSQVAAEAFRYFNR